MSLDSKGPVFLPQSLEKLKIESAASEPENMNSTKHLNPFYYLELDNSSVAIGPMENSNLFGPQSESQMENEINRKNELKILHKNGPSVTKVSFKSKHKHGQKNLLKMPILKYIETANFNVKSEPEEYLDGQPQPSTSCKCYSNLQPLAIGATEMTSFKDCHHSSNKKSIDFKTLVDTCANLTLSSSFLNSKSSSFASNQYRSKDTSKKSKYTPGSVLATAATNTAQISTGDLDNLTPNTSCSQQALLNSTNCDVTIDELACYFETFVHIPKKMSSMAEMMYI